MAEKEKKTPRKKTFLKEFKEFAMKGNVIDLAVGIIIGGAFGKITNSLVEDIFMPVIGKVLGGVNFEEFVVVLSTADSKDPITIKLGQFIGTIVDFVLIALCVFLMIKLINTFRNKKDEEPEEPPAPKEPTPDIVLLTEIRDLLKK